MKQAVLVIIKPDGMKKNLAGQVLETFGRSGLKLISMALLKTTREKTEEHYQGINDQPFFAKQVSFFLGDTTGIKELAFFVYYGNDAVAKARMIAGSTNPEEADPQSIRGRYGRITTKDIYENVVHVSSDDKEAQREIKLWLSPDDLTQEIYPVKLQKDKQGQRRVWS